MSDIFSLFFFFFSFFNERNTVNDGNRKIFLSKSKLSREWWYEFFKRQIREGHSWALVPWKEMSAILDENNVETGVGEEEDLDTMKVEKPLQPPQEQAGENQSHTSD